MRIVRANPSAMLAALGVGAAKLVDYFYVAITMCFCVTCKQPCDHSDIDNSWIGWKGNSNSFKMNQIPMKQLRSRWLHFSLRSTLWSWLTVLLALALHGALFISFERNPLGHKLHGLGCLWAWLFLFVLYSLSLVWILPIHPPILMTCQLTVYIYTTKFSLV